MNATTVHRVLFALLIANLVVSTALWIRHDKPPGNPASTQAPANHSPEAKTAAPAAPQDAQKALDDLIKTLPEDDEALLARAFPDSAWTPANTRRFEDGSFVTTTASWSLEQKTYNALVEDAKRPGVSPTVSRWRITWFADRNPDLPSSLVPTLLCTGEDGAGNAIGPIGFLGHARTEPVSSFEQRIIWAPGPLKLKFTINAPCIVRIDCAK
jgi:hypothetical protein